MQSQSRRRLPDRRRAPWRALLSTVVALGGCGGAATTGPGATATGDPALPSDARPGALPGAMAAAECHPAPDPARILLLEWPALDKALLLSQANQGVVLAGYDGCSLRVISGCQVAQPAPYRFQPITPARDSVVITREDQLRAALPLSIVSLEGLVARGSELHFDYVAVGQQRASVDSLDGVALRGPECGQVTHWVRSFLVGAHELTTAQRQRAEGSVGAAGAGVGARNASARAVERQSGDVPLCALPREETVATPGVDTSAPRLCGALLQVELARVGPSTPGSAGSPAVVTTTAPTGSGSPAPSSSGSASSGGPSVGAPPPQAPTPGAAGGAPPSSADAPTDPTPTQPALAAFQEAEDVFARREWAPARAAYQGFLKAHGAAPENARLIVKANFRLAEVAAELKDARGRTAALAAAVAGFVSTGSLPGSEAAEWAAQARYQQAEEKLAAYEALRVAGKDAAAVARAAATMVAAARALEGQYRAVVLYRRPTWTVAAAFRIGYLYDRLAGVVLSVEPPASMKDAEARTAFSQALSQQMVAIEDRAVAEYRIAAAAAEAGRVETEEAHRARERLNYYLPAEFPFDRKGRPPFVVYQPLGKAGIQRTVRARIGQLRSCYERALTRNPKLEGKLTLGFAIDSSGGTSAVGVEAEGIDDAEMKACVVSTVERWVFPVPPGAALTTVKYPLHFTPG